MSLNEFDETRQVEDRRSSGWLEKKNPIKKKLSTADEEFLKVMSFRKRKNPPKD